VPDPHPRTIPGLLVEKPDPKAVLANAVSLWLGGASTALPWEGSTVTFQEKIPPDVPDRDLAPAVAQLAVTGRAMFTEFAAWKPQDHVL
jgi:hypothetical protein